VVDGGEQLTLNVLNAHQICLFMYDGISRLLSRKGDKSSTVSYTNNFYRGSSARKKYGCDGFE
jgi:hypothetical protein